MKKITILYFLVCGALAGCTDSEIKHEVEPELNKLNTILVNGERIFHC